MNSSDLEEGAVFSPGAAKFPEEINNALRQAESCSTEAGKFQLLLEMIFIDYGIMRKECTKQHPGCQ